MAKKKFYASSQTPSTAAPEYSEAEVINTKEENK